MKQADWEAYHAAYDAAQADFDYEASDDEASIPTSTPRPARKRKRRPTFASVARQAAKAGIEVARYEVDPDTGKIIIVPGKPEIASDKSEPNEWDTVQ
jgi:hypothetical protein